MDLKALRIEVVEATSQVLADRHGFVPSDDSDEWEEEYRRQYELAKKRHAHNPVAATTGAKQPAPSRPMPELIGTPEQQRWAATIREDRLKEIADPQIRAWLAHDWLRAKAWIDTRAIPAETFRSRAREWFADHRRAAAEKAKQGAAERQSAEAATAAIRDRVAAAGITAAGLIELIDASERADRAVLTTKLAEITHGGRTIRVFESSDPNLLAVKEKSRTGQSDYAIERDEGLVEDLRLFGQLR